MVSRLRHGVAGVGVLGMACLAGCAAPPRTAAIAPAPGSTPYFTVRTPIEQIAADQRGKAVLVHDVPGVMSNRSYELFSSMSLVQLAQLSGGRLTQSKLNKVNADLAELSPAQ